MFTNIYNIYSRNIIKYVLEFIINSLFFCDYFHIDTILQYYSTIIKQLVYSLHYFIYKLYYSARISQIYKESKIKKLCIMIHYYILCSTVTLVDRKLHIARRYLVLCRPSNYTSFLLWMYSFRNFITVHSSFNYQIILILLFIKIDEKVLNLLVQLFIKFNNCSQKNSIDHQWRKKIILIFSLESGICQLYIILNNLDNFQWI